MQLSSVSLPVGGYAFSQGLEYAIEEQWLTSSEDIKSWLELQLHTSQLYVDVPVMYRLFQCLDIEDNSGLGYWNDYVIACRETKEFRLSDIAMGTALRKLLKSQGVPIVLAENCVAPSFLTLFTIAAHYWNVTAECSALGYLWSWLENQIAAATKLLPLGQTQAQSLLGELQAVIPEIIHKAKKLSDDELGASLPGLAIASTHHETQYSRLFRS